MEFTGDKAIYIQIKDFVMEGILLGQWQPEGKIPSVRELGGDIEVNPNTVIRAYDLLQQSQIIYNKRGLGFFVSSNAVEIINREKKKEFVENELPALFKTLDLLKMDISELNELYQKYIQSKD